VALLKADAGQFWDADPGPRPSASRPDSSRRGRRAQLVVGVDKTTHPVARTFLDKTLTLSDDDGRRGVFPGKPAQRRRAAFRAAAIPLYADELVGVLSIAAAAARRSGPRPQGRLELLADAGAVALHNARLHENDRAADRARRAHRPLQPLFAHEATESELRRAERNGQSIAVAHVRMDGLAEAIQRLGPSFGDSILPKGAASAGALDPGRQPRRARSGRPLLDPDLRGREAQAHRAMRSVQKSFEGSLDPRLDQMGVKLSLTAGIAVYPDDAFDTPTLLSGAQSALEEAVKAGPGSVVLYHAPAQDPVLR
jgi:GGDEF domain-containing protein